MGNFVIILIVVIVGVVVYKSTQNKNNYSVKVSNGNSDDDSDDYEESTYDTNTQLGRDYRKEREEKWNFEFYGGNHLVRTDEGEKEEYWEGFKNYFRREVCESESIISDEEVIEIHHQYQSEYHPITDSETRLVEVNKIKRFIHKEFCEPLKSDKYDTNTKSWTDFDVTGVIMRVRGHMIDRVNPFPHYVWNVVSGNPFERIYRICRDYTKWKGTLRTSKTLFDNVCKWENGKIFREGEPNMEFESPLWINWNKVGKDFLSWKTKLKKDSPEGLKWLKESVGGYIRERKEFYLQFGEDSEYCISPELIEKFKNL